MSRQARFDTAVHELLTCARTGDRRETKARTVIARTYREGEERRGATEAEAAQMMRDAWQTYRILKNADE